MNPWVAKAVVLAASVAMVAIRAPHGQRSRFVKVAADHKGSLEVALLSLVALSFFVPLIWVASSAFDFAEIPPRLDRLVAGSALFAGGLWVFHRSHADLGTNWSITLQVREGHRLVTHGIYRRVRHPMYLGLLLYSLGQALALPNLLAGPSCLVSFGLLFALRLRAEERMMLQTFGDEYRDYMARTRRLIPGVW